MLTLFCKKAAVLFEKMFGDFVYRSVENKPILLVIKAIG